MPGIVTIVDVPRIGNGEVSCFAICLLYSVFSRNNHLNFNIFFSITQFCVQEDDHDGNGIIAHFPAHAGQPVSEMAFDPR